MTRDEVAAPPPNAMEALESMLAAIRILDEMGAPADIGCHLDLAIARLKERLGLAPAPDPFGHFVSGGREPDPGPLDEADGSAPDRVLFSPV